MANTSKKTAVGKSPALGVKMASPAAIMVATTKAMMNKNEDEDLKMVIAGLRSELDAEKRTVRQLRRERDSEVQKVRNEEQTRASIALKDQSKKLLEEKQREVELQRETLKIKLESDLGKVVKLKDREITKLRGDLARCQDELKEELSKRGLSTSARASFDTERQKLLQEVRDLQLAKRQLEERLTEAGETEKRLQLEIRLLQDSCKLEAARVEREATLEVKKLLEELKTKDHMLELMDRSIYPDRTTILKNRLEKLSIEEMLNLNAARWSNNKNSCSNASSSSSSRCSCAAEQLENTNSAAESLGYSCSANDCSCSNSCKCSDESSCKSKTDDGSCSCSKKEDNVNKEVESFSSKTKTCHNGARSSSCSNRISYNSCRVNNKLGSNKRSRSASAMGTSQKSKKLNNGQTRNDISFNANDKTRKNIPRPASALPFVSSSLSSSTPNWSADHCIPSGGCALQTVNLQKKLYETEKRVKLAEGLNRAVVEKNNALSANGKQLENKIKTLTQHINNMKTEQSANEREIKRLNDVVVNIKAARITDHDVDLCSELEFCRQRCSELEQVLTNLRRECLEKDHRIGLLIKSQQKPRHKHERKTVRFMLPDDAEEKTSYISEEDTVSRTSSSCSDPIQADELLIQSMHKDYEVLMDEHLKLQKYCASLVQQCQSLNNNSENQELHVKRESLDIAIQAMEEKLKMAEEREQNLKQKLQEVYDQNEELEFRVLELEEINDKNKSGSNPDLSMQSQRQLEMEVQRLRLRLAKYGSLDIAELKNDASPFVLAEVTSVGDQRLSVENLRKLTASLSDSDEENQMVQSFSTMTSGFDEISCISLELDDRTEMPDMPGEEEADLEKDADDVGPEMPTEECDIIPEMCYSSYTDVSQASYEETESPIDIVGEHTSHDSMIEEAHQSSNAQKIETISYIPRELDDLQEPSKEVCYPAEFIPNRTSSSIETANFERKPQHVMDLEDQVDILVHVDHTYCKTIDTLNQIEQKLQFFIPLDFIENASNTPDQFKECTQDDIETFWSVASTEIESNISSMKNEINCLVSQEHDSVEVTDAKIESQNIVSHCMEVLRGTSEVLQKENDNCNELDKRIAELQQQELCKADDLNELMLSCKSSLTNEPFQSMALPPAEQDNSSFLGSLKRLAFDVVAAGFRTDLLELRSLTHEFFSAADEDELNDIAYIDEDDAACVLSDASTPAEKDLPSKLQQRTELRLNTKICSLNQRFDFLSPTSFDNPNWNESSHLETVNHCLLLQIEDLERERDSLKDIVCRDDAVINEMTQQITSLENSEQELKRIVSRLEASDEQASEHICRLESEYHSIRTKLCRAESAESSLRAELQAQGKREAEMEAKLLRSVESLENTTSKLRSSLNETEKEKRDALKQSEELNALIVALKHKETSMQQRIKSYENLHAGLKEKTNELEASLTLAYDEVAGLTGQKDSLIQRLNSVTDENADLIQDIEELNEEKKNFVAELERLTESEIFLKEANRKMWLSLQANIEEREMSENRQCKHCSRTVQYSEEVHLEAEETTSVDKNSERFCTETDKCSVSSLDASKQSISGLSQILGHLSTVNPCSILTIVSLVSDLLCCYSHLRTSSVVDHKISQGSLESEKKARLEEMLKFVASTRLRSSANALKSSTATGEKQVSNGDDYNDVTELDHVEGEEGFWSVVENYEDIYDVRAADTWNLWRHLEQDIMGLNLDQLRKLLEEREAEKSCQTTFPEVVQAVPSITLEQSTQCDSDVNGGQGDSALPPLPTSLPPPEESEIEYEVIACSEQSTQTEVYEAKTPTQSESEEDLSVLRHLLNQNERTLAARKNEVDRLTVELRSWQQKALEASDQVSRLTTELSTAQQFIETTKYRTLPEYRTSTSSIIDNKLQSDVSTERRSRIELPSSQIPVSVKRAVDFYSSISQRSGSTSSGSSQASVRSRTASTSPGPTTASFRTASSSPVPSQASSTFRTTLVSPGQAGSSSRTISLIPRYVVELQRGNGQQQTTTTSQGPLGNGSSFSENQQQDLPPSQIPRLLPDWVQQQQQLLTTEQSTGERMDTRISEDHDEMVAGSSSNLQQLPIAAADTSAAVASSDIVAAAAETEMPLLSDDVTITKEEEREF